VPWPDGVKETTMIETKILNRIVHDLLRRETDNVSLSEVELPENGEPQCERTREGDQVYVVAKAKLTAAQRKTVTKDLEYLACLCLKQSIEVKGETNLTRSEQVDATTDHIRHCLNFEFTDWKKTQ
jgi:hypothetical protein